MFWKFNLLTSSHIDTLLDKEDVTLRELMDEDDILQECKAQNRKLVDFLIQPENMEEMVKLITVDPPNDVDEKIRFKYPNTACELLTSDVARINEKLAGDEELVNKLYAFLEGVKPLNPLLASFFSKVMGLLITRKSEMIFEYLKTKDDFVGHLLYHIGTSAVMDLLLRLITCIESPDTRRAVIEWLNKEKIVEKLVDSIVASKDEDIHCNAAQSLCDIVRLGREQFIQQQDTSDPDPLLVTMEQEETVSRLLSNMFDSNKNESVLVNGLCVIHTLLEVRRQGTELSDQLPNGETDRFTQGINNVIAAIIPRLKDFHDLLVNPPKQCYSRMPTTFGCLEPPLGNTRLQVAKLITALVGANMHQVNVELTSLGTIPTLLDLNFKYEWNNFLHTQVEQCLLIILNNGPTEITGKLQHPLLAQLFSEYNLLQRLLTEWEGNEQQQNAKNGMRRGFMGHLTKIANSISGLLEKSDTSLIKEQFSGLSQDVRDNWGVFVAGPLAEVNKKNMIELMRGHPLASSSEDDDADFKDIPFPQDTAMQQLQQMTSNFIDQFGFNDEEFAEQDEKIEAAFSDKISSIDSEIQGNDNQHSATLFEQVCNEKIQQFDDDSDEDIWEEKPITFDKSAQHARLERLQAATARCNSSDEDSTDSGEELDSPVKILQQPAEGMDVDNSEGNWPADSSSHSEHTAMDTTYSPWEKPSPAAPVAAAITTTTPTPPEEGWADFTKLPDEPQNAENWADFTTFTDFQSSTVQGPRSSSPVEMDTTENIRGNPYVVSSNSNKHDQKDSATTVSVTVTLPGGLGDIHGTDIDEKNTSSPLPDSTSPGQHVSQTLSSSDSSFIVNGNRAPTPDSSLQHLSHSTSAAHSVESLTTDSQVSSTSSDSAVVSSASDSKIQPVNSATIHSSSSDPLLTQINEEVASYASVVASGVHAASSTTIGCVVSSSPQSVSASSSQSFLAGSGLIKTTNPVAASSSSSSRLLSESQGNGPVTSPASPTTVDATPSPLSTTSLLMADGDSSSQEPDTAQCMSSPGQKIEQARAQAKDAQEQFDAAMTVLHNGPV
uniref:Uncharacterized protein n=1 Tax=Arion vulgaris TaxID=1028688 RepID=A0A0B7APN8_9EUPU